VSDHLTIAFVTAALHDIVQAAVQDVAPGVVVRVGPPRAATPGEKEVNLCLYHLTPNAQLRNNDLPTRNAAGELVARPQVAIDLHYLISFSSEDHLATELMLGKVLTALHAAPVLTGAELRRTVRARSAFAFLRDSDLPRQLDRIKIVPQTLTLDELAKLWTVFFQIAHRPSLSYIASAVLLDADGGPIDAPRRARSAVTA